MGRHLGRGVGRSVQVEVVGVVLEVVRPEASVGAAVEVVGQGLADDLADLAFVSCEGEGGGLVAGEVEVDVAGADGVGALDLEGAGAADPGGDPGVGPSWASCLALRARPRSVVWTSTASRRSFSRCGPAGWRVPSTQREMVRGATP
ncbi:hypothetical protein [Kitasatospora sp. NPDC088783]|uniref:hypothetical protein n=1 Tax=Kitasatospora sp. NPDC088783 TaxID=3364077 RepID=UPI003826DE3B